jgi:2-alkenal reductase
MVKTRIIALILVFFALPALACGFLSADPAVTFEEPQQVVVTQAAVQVESQSDIEQSVPVEPPVVSFDATTSEEAVLIDLYQHINPSVVNITIYATGPSGALIPSSEGSGFVYDSTGNIVTNAHVVHGAERIEINFSDGRVRPADLVGEDFNSDLAVVQVVELPEGVQPLPLGSMENLAVGQTVAAIGNPFGNEGTLTRGIISALGRTIPALNVFSIPQSIQTDAAINPGNSGGPLLNLQGEVIGVNAQISTDGETRANSGVGFAIPVSIVSRVVPSLIETGGYEWTWVGISGGSVSFTIAKANDLPDDRGAYVGEVVQDGPADKAGLRGATSSTTEDGIRVPTGGDVIVGIDGMKVNTFDDLLVYIALETEPGQEVLLTVIRNGEQIEVPLTLEARPPDFQQNQ